MRHHQPEELSANVSLRRQTWIRQVECQNVVFALKTLLSRDKEELILTFKMLGVDPADMFVYEDLADTEMKSKLESAALTLNEKHKNFAWVAVIILSHGLMKNGEDAIVGVNGNSVLVDDVCVANDNQRFDDFFTDQRVVLCTQDSRVPRQTQVVLVSSVSSD